MQKNVSSIAALYYYCCLKLLMKPIQTQHSKVDFKTAKFRNHLAMYTLPTLVFIIYLYWVTSGTYNIGLIMWWRKCRSIKDIFRSLRWTSYSHVILVLNKMWTNSFWDLNLSTACTLGENCDQRHCDQRTLCRFGPRSIIWSSFSAKFDIIRLMRVRYMDLVRCDCVWLAAGNY